MRDLEFVAARLGWVRRQARRIAKRNVHTDTNELVSTTCRRLGDLPDKSDRFNSTRDGQAYVQRVMMNASTEHARKADRERARRQRRAEELLLHRVAEIDFPEFDPEDVAQVIHEMAMLSTGHRNILNLYCRGQTSEQIAGSHGNSSTIRSHIRQCKRDIRLRLAEQQR